MALELNEVPLFAGLSEAQLQWVAQHSTPLSHDAGVTLIAEGGRPDALYILLDGALEISGRAGEREIVYATLEAGAFVGEMFLLEGPHPLTVRTRRHSCMRAVALRDAQHMMAAFPNVVNRLVETLAERVRSIERVALYQDRMSSIVTVAAGLAHELNNPVSASVRATEQLEQAFKRLPSVVRGLRDLTLPQLTTFEALQREITNGVRQEPALDSLARSEREEALTAWMQARHVEEGWKCAPTFVSMGVEVAHLERLAAAIEPPLLGKVLGWLEAFLLSHEQFRVIQQSNRRITEVVQTFKAYSRMDRAPVRKVDVHEGLDNTLLILRHRWGDGGIKIVRDYDRSLPPISAYGGELNQVWTNLIANAIDALDGHGTVWIRTAREGDDHIVVEIADDGPGIPPEVQPHIFEPFFTTKGAGHGTGLGLDIAYRLVTERHHGSLRVLSEPGDTRFQVRLPVTLPE
ncbi:MAG: ATP-binding protein [Anaerolineae bacterium]|nr:ATP-binding protein [Anaerolineae bacterium]